MNAVASPIRSLSPAATVDIRPMDDMDRFDVPIETRSRDSFRVGFGVVGAELGRVLAPDMLEHPKRAKGDSSQRKASASNDGTRDGTRVCIRVGHFVVVREVTNVVPC